MRRLPLLPLLLLLAWPAHVQAGWRIDRARQIADRVWNHPCNGNIRVSWEALPDDWRAAARDGDCATGVILNTNAQFLGFSDLCSAFLHEVGHLARYRDWSNTADPLHSANPKSVMYRDAFVTYGGEDHWTGVDKRCLNRGRTYLKLESAASRTNAR